MKELTLTDFAPHLESKFRLSAEGVEPIDVQLIEATDLTRPDQLRGKKVRSNPFSLIFLGPADLQLPQQMYQLEHAALGSLTLFLVPVGPDDQGQGLCYEAIFN